MKQEKHEKMVSYGEGRSLNRNAGTLGLYGLMNESFPV